MNLASNVLVIEQIEAAINELRPQLGLGPVTKVAGINVFAPLVAVSDPTHPTVVGSVCDGRVCICVEWVIAMYTCEEVEKLLMRAVRPRARAQRERLQSAGIVLALGVILASNHGEGTSCAGLDSATGNVFVRDSLGVNGNELAHLKERLTVVIQHARYIRNTIMRLWSNGLELPDQPESPLANGFSNE